MRLQKLKLENITSLKGEHTIDFNEISKQSDLFAITGPTGSGKSTLLMAMAMALYGQNHKGLNAADLVTTQCPFGRIELEFTLQGKSYLVIWSCQTLKKDGSPRKVPLTQRHWYIDGIEADTDATDIIGLSWDQFTKVIILNQGQFSEFLTSTFNKRKEILEKLMGHGQLEILGKNLRRKLSELEQEINSLQGQSDFAKIMTEQEYKALQARQEQLIKEVEYVEASANKCQTIEKKVHEDILLKEKKLEICEQQNKKAATQEELQKEMMAIQSKLKVAESQLQEQQKLYKERRPLLKEAGDNQNQVNQLQIKSTQIQKSIHINSEQIRTKNTSLTEREKELSNVETLANELKSKIKEDYDILALKTKYKNVQLSFNQLEKKLDGLQSLKQEKENIEQEGQESKNLFLDKIENQFLVLFKEQKDLPLEKIKASLASEDFPTLKTTLAHTQKEIDVKIKKRHTQEEEIKGLSLEQTHARERYSKHELLIQDFITKNEIIKKEHEELSYKQREIEEGIVVITSENRKWELLKLTYEELGHNHNIHQGHTDSISSKNIPKDWNDPCPVCSSTNLSWDQILAPLTQGTQAGLAKQSSLEQELKAVMQKLETLTIHLKENTKRIEELTKEQVELNNQINQRKEKLTCLKENILTPTTQELTTIAQAFGQQQYELDHFQQQRQKLIQRWKINDEELKNKELEVAQLNQELNLLSIALSEFNPSFASLKSSHSYPHQLTMELKGFQKKLDEIGNEIDQELKKQNELNILQEKINGLRQGITTLNLDIEALTKVNNAHILEDKQLSSSLTELINKASIKKYPKNPEQELEALESKLEKDREHKEKVTKEKIDIDTRYRQGSEQLSNLKERLEELEKLHILYINEVKSALLQLRELTGPDLKDLYITDKKSWSNYLEKYTLQKWDGLLNQDQLRLDKQFLYESIQPQAQKAQELFLELKQNSAAIEQEIKTYREQQERIATLTKQIEAKKKQWEQFEVLNHYIGKDRFRDFALTILENTLLDMANHEIKSLAEGRYELLHAKAGKRSEFMVKDHWHGGNERKVSTLSGGETFLLSLGLAMGLSDITRGQTEIESFFIDEGFGTLDDESIGQVLDCLMAIQSRGKQIGLISHVTALTSQIPIRLEVTKNNFGESTLSIN